MELAYVFGIAFGLALWVGLAVRKAMEREAAYQLALAAFAVDPDNNADPDQGWPRESRPYTSPPPPRRKVDTIAPITEWPQPEPPERGVT